jgi:hypothetical protein
MRPAQPLLGGPPHRLNAVRMPAGEGLIAKRPQQAGHKMGGRVQEYPGPSLWVGRPEPPHPWLPLFGYAADIPS